MGFDLDAEKNIMEVHDLDPIVDYRLSQLPIEFRMLYWNWMEKIRLPVGLEDNGFALGMWYNPRVNVVILKG